MLRKHNLNPEMETFGISFSITSSSSFFVWSIVDELCKGPVPHLRCRKKVFQIATSKMWDRPFTFILCVVKIVEQIITFAVGYSRLDIRSQVEVKDQNMVKHPLGIYHRKRTPQRNSLWGLHTVYKSYGK